MQQIYVIMSNGKFIILQCLLFESQLADIITIHVDLLGNIYGVSVATPHNQQCAGSVPEFDPAFNTTVLISYMEHGPMYTQFIHAI